MVEVSFFLSLLCSRYLIYFHHKLTRPIRSRDETIKAASASWGGMRTGSSDSVLSTHTQWIPVSRLSIGKLVEPITEGPFSTPLLACGGWTSNCSAENVDAWGTLFSFRANTAVSSLCHRRDREVIPSHRGRIQVIADAQNTIRADKKKKKICDKGAMNMTFNLLIPSYVVLFSKQIVFWASPSTWILLLLVVIGHYTSSRPRIN